MYISIVVYFLRKIVTPFFLQKKITLQIKFQHATSSSFIVCSEYNIYVDSITCAMISCKRFEAWCVKQFTMDYTKIRHVKIFQP